MAPNDTFLSAGSAAAPLLPNTEVGGAAACAILGAARLLNSDLGRHSKTRRFTSSLSGRFYCNHSMEVHTERKNRAERMKARRRRLERAIRTEDRRISALEIRLGEAETRRMEALEMMSRAERAAIRIQACFRMVLAERQAELMAVEARIKEYIAIFCQSAYRGARGRQRVQERRRERRAIEIQLEMEERASARIQAVARGFLARCIAEQRSREQRERNSAIRIQSVERMRRKRQQYRYLLERKKKRKHDMATIIQAAYRGVRGRLIPKAMMEEKQEREAQAAREKWQKRIPLHLRRYSSYSIKGNSAGSERKDRAVSEMGESQKNMGKYSFQRRVSCPDLFASAPSIERISSDRVRPPSRPEENTQKTLPDRIGIDIENVQGTPQTTKKKDEAALKAKVARQKAAARVAELERRARREKEKEVENKKTKAGKMAKALEAQRRRARNAGRQATWQPEDRERGRPSVIRLHDGGGECPQMHDSRQRAARNMSAMIEPSNSEGLINENISFAQLQSVCSQQALSQPRERDKENKSPKEEYVCEPTQPKFSTQENDEQNANTHIGESGDKLDYVTNLITTGSPARLDLLRPKIVQIDPLRPPSFVVPHFDAVFEDDVDENECDLDND